MFFATATLPRRHAYARSPSLERFLADTLRAGSQPGCASSESESAYTLTLDVPGLSKEQLHIAIEGNVVRIMSRDGAPRSYRAAYEMAQEIDAAQSHAKLENGVLQLTLAKKQPENRATELTVH